jgi:hypothetical protein
MTRLADGTVVTDIDSDDNAHLINAGYTIRHIETWHDQGQSCIAWDAPQITEADCPF